MSILLGSRAAALLQEKRLREKRLSGKRAQGKVLRSAVLQGIVLLGMVLPVAAAELRVDLAKSHFSAAFKQMGVTVQAPFTEADVKLSYDAADPAAARAEVRIAVASFDLGEPMYNAEIGKPEWFDATAHPQAVFVSQRVEPQGDGTLLVHGHLTLKGHTEPVAVPVSVTPGAGGYRFAGEFIVSRLAFGIGTGEWRDTSLVADPVTLRFDVLAAGE